MNCVLKTEMSDGSEVTFEGCISFVFEKDMYIPYTKASGRFYLRIGESFSPADIRKIRLYIGGELRHCGLPDSVSLSERPEGKILSFTSRGFTVLLVQNEPYPKINSDVDLGSLITKNLIHPEIGYESSTPQVGYIYVKEKSTVWDAVTAYSIKAVGNYPYIRGTNTVSCTAAGGEKDYSGVLWTEREETLSSSQILSEVNMADADGQYVYSAADDMAQQLGIVRRKYFPLDRQWLYSPESGLRARLSYCARMSKGISAAYEGSVGEDIMDTAVNAGAMSGKRINSLRIWGNYRGVFTKIRAYEDRYGQK
ncbi:MAG: hypothetical protein J5994_03010 [Ruminococcus sp.]|nr:hypothetical protein [Ruminococcus sp.]